MRIVKQRLLEMIPDLRVFLECAREVSLKSCTPPLLTVQHTFHKAVHPLAGSADDLKNIANLDRYIALAKAVLIFCTDGYFASRNCMVELRTSVKMGKLIIALMDPDASKGGLTQNQVREQLVEAETSLYTKWRFDGGPSAAELYTMLFNREPVEWNRIGAFQDV